MTIIPKINTNVKYQKRKIIEKLKKICLFYNKNHPKIAFILTVPKVFY